MLKPLSVALFLRVTLAVLGLYFIDLPYSGDDASYNESTGWILSQSGFWEIFQDDVGRSGSEYYIRFVGFIYYFFGRHPSLPVFVNVVLGSLTIINSYYTVKLLWGTKWAKKCAWILALFPSMILFSSVMLREAPAYFFASFGLLYLIKFLRSRQIFHFIYFLISFILAASLHSIFILVPISVMIYGLLNQWDRKKARRIFSKKNLLRIFLPFTFVIVLAFNSGFGFSKFSRLFSSFSNSNQFATFINVIADSQKARSKEKNRSTYLSGFVVSNPMDLLFHAPIRITYFLFTPFPWMVSSLPDLFGLLDAFLYIVLFYMIFSDFKQRLNNKSQKMLLFTLIIVLSILSISTSNYGTAIRHRAKLLVFVVTLLPSVAHLTVKKKNISIYNS